MSRKTRSAFVQTLLSRKKQVKAKPKKKQGQRKMRPAGRRPV